MKKRKKKNTSTKSDDFWSTEVSSISNNIQENKRLFESKFTYVCAGSFLLSVSIVSNVVDIHNTCSSWLIFVSWGLLLIALLLNLFSCFYCADAAHKTVEEMNKHTGNTDCYFRCIFPKKMRRIKVSDSLNKTCVVLFALGCITFYVYLVINLY